VRPKTQIQSDSTLAITHSRVRSQLPDIRPEHHRGAFRPSPCPSNLTSPVSPKVHYLVRLIDFLLPQCCMVLEHYKGNSISGSCVSLPHAGCWSSLWTHRSDLSIAMSYMRPGAGAHVSLCERCLTQLSSEHNPKRRPFLSLSSGLWGLPDSAYVPWRGCFCPMSEMPAHHCSTTSCCRLISNSLQRMPSAAVIS
jgi:hypothetical protein